MDDLPLEILCTCNGVSAYLLLKEAKVKYTDADGKTHIVDPPKFEAYAGRGSAKKWKSSLRVDGVPKAQGMEIGRYLQEWLGVDINRGVFHPIVIRKSVSSAEISPTQQPAMTNDSLAAHFGSLNVGYQEPSKSQRYTKDGSLVPSVYTIRLHGTWKVPPVDTHDVPTTHHDDTNDSTPPDLVCTTTETDLLPRSASDGQAASTCHAPPAKVGISGATSAGGVAVNSLKRAPPAGWKERAAVVRAKLTGGLPPPPPSKAVEVVRGRAVHDGVSVLDLSELSMNQLAGLSEASGSLTAFDGCCLQRPESEQPGVRTSKLAFSNSYNLPESVLASLAALKSAADKRLPSNTQKRQYKSPGRVPGSLMKLTLANSRELQPTMSRLMTARLVDDKAEDDVPSSSDGCILEIPWSALGFEAPIWCDKALDVLHLWTEVSIRGGYTAIKKDWNLVAQALGCDESTSQLRGRELQLFYRILLLEYERANRKIRTSRTLVAGSEG